MTDPEARQRARATWSAGDFDAVAQRIWSVGSDLVDRVGVSPGDDALDVACGTGNAAIPAAVAGATVTGLDITPELFEAGRRRATEAGVEIEWVEGDAERLLFDAAAFDIVLSTFGCMFAPDHRATAAEIARVLRPGGRFGIASWRPEGAIGGFFRTIASHAPPPPPGFQPPPMWGLRDHVSELFEGTGAELSFEDATVEIRFESLEEAITEYERKFGPVVMLRAALEPEGRWDAARADLTAYFEQIAKPDGEGFAFEAEYLVVLGEQPD